MNRLLRLLLICLLFSHKLHVSGSYFFQIDLNNLPFLSGSVTRLFVAPQNQVRIDKFKIEQEGDFAVIVEDRNGAFLVSEKTFEEIIAEIKDLRCKLLAVDRSEVLKCELLQKIYDLYDDQSEIFADSRKEHLITLDLIYKARNDLKYIPNSIFRAYLHFVATRIVLPHVANDVEVCDGVFFIINKMIRRAHNPENIEILLKVAALHFSLNQRVFLFECCHLMFREYAQSQSKIPERNRKVAIERPYSIYLMLLNYFDLSLDSFEMLKMRVPPHPLFKSFFEIVLPYYRTLLLINLGVKSMTFPIISYRELDSYEMITVLDFFIKNSYFNNNFLVSKKTFEFKKRVFQKIRYAFFQNEHLLKIILFIVESKLKNLFESVLIYSERGSDFTCTILNLIEIFIRTRKMGISYFASLLANCPDITVETLETNVRDWSSELKTTVFIDLPIIKSIKRLIVAIESMESIERTSYWDVSPEYLELIRSDSHDPRDFDLIQAGRIYLLRAHGIPFSNSKVHEDVSEDADWLDMIGFVNIVLDRECKKFNFRKIIIRTRDTIIPIM